MESESPTVKHVKKRRKVPADVPADLAETITKDSRSSQENLVDDKHRARGGHVFRRTDREINPLPPPDFSDTHPDRTSILSRRRRKRHGVQETDHSNANTIALGKESEVSSPMPHDDEPEEKRRQRMNEKLRSLEPALKQRLSKSDQIRQELEIFGRHSPDISLTPERSRLHSMMLKYIEKNEQRMLEDAMTALKRAAVSSRAVRDVLVHVGVFNDSDAIFFIPENQLQSSSLMEIFRSGGLKYEFVQKHASSAGVYRILIRNDDSNEENPIHVSGISYMTLRSMGWRLAQRNSGDGESRDWYWWRYRRGQSASTKNEIFRARMTGEIDGLWRDGDEDPDFDAFVNAGEEKEQ
ncbi:hypothetical protein ZTR_07403 [Talaromyces verruculosus]|nr:hypothetical protein ZTR_07403 [Talaromyces verruculosus]